MSDIFLNEDVRRLFQNKTVVLIGDSNIRGLYKDIVWLLNVNSLIPYECLSAKGEARYPDFNNWKKSPKEISPRIRSIFNSSNRDKLVKFSGLHAGRGYIEERHYFSREHDVNIYFVFTTRVWTKYLEEWLKTFDQRTDSGSIDILLMSSCLWDFNRWGPFGIREFKENLNKLMKLVKVCLPTSSQFVWLTGLPVSTNLQSKAMQVPGLEFQCRTSCFNVTELNFYTAHKVSMHGHSVIDMHYYSHIQSFKRCSDGIHWKPESNRFFTNLVLTFLCSLLKQPLPGRATTNYALEKMKLLAQVSQQSEIQESDVVEKLKELTSLANRSSSFDEERIYVELRNSRASASNTMRTSSQEDSSRTHPYSRGLRGKPQTGNRRSCPPNMMQSNHFRNPQPDTVQSNSTPLVWNVWKSDVVNEKDSSPRGIRRSVNENHLSAAPDKRRKTGSYNTMPEFDPWANARPQSQNISNPSCSISSNPLLPVSWIEDRGRPKVDDRVALSSSSEPSFDPYIQLNLKLPEPAGPSWRQNPLERFEEMSCTRSANTSSENQPSEQRSSEYLRRPATLSRHFSTSVDDMEGPREPALTGFHSEFSSPAQEDLSPIPWDNHCINPAIRRQMAGCQSREDLLQTRSSVSEFNIVNPIFKCQNQYYTRRDET